MSFSFILILLLLAAGYYFFLRKKGNMKWSPMTIAVVLIVALIFLPKIGNAIGANTYTSVPSTQVNACGCQPGQLVNVKFKPFLKKARYNLMTCSSALALMSQKPKRTSFAGCSIS